MNAHTREILKRVENNELTTAEAYKLIQEQKSPIKPEIAAKEEHELAIFGANGDFSAEDEYGANNEYAANDQYSDVSSEKLENEIKNYLLETIAFLVGKNVSKINENENFMNLGVDSSALITVTSKMEEEWGIELYPTLLFEYQNINDLSSYFANEHGDKLMKVFDIKAEKIQQKPSSPPFDQAVRKQEPPPERLKQEVPIMSKKNTMSNRSDIAIIGMSGIFPGSPNLQEFWQNLAEGKDLMGEIPLNHFDYRPWYDPDPEASDKMYSKWGGFIAEVANFDAAFFNISPKEAVMMDPQLRLLLQVLYETAEDAGYPQKIRGSKTGIYVGACFHDYEERLHKYMGAMDPYLGTGNSATMLSNRPSFYFDLRGPSLTVDTACSSSLVALHLAAKALQNQECEMALVAGTNLLLSPAHYRYFCSIGALSPSGRSHSFDKRADGYTPGEGVAAVLLKPLEAAIQDGDRIHALIKGSAINHGGYTPSVTAPSMKQEAEVISLAWEDAGINPETISYIEAHGTGTKLGDPIEVNGIKTAFRKYTDKEAFCLLGSAKAHIGHTEGTAGIAGIIKTILSMKNNTIPAMPMFHELNPYIDLKNAPISINTENINWKKNGDHPRRAGISSFGFGGAYAHVVIEDYEDTAGNQRSGISASTSQLIPLSAKNEERLQEQISNLITYIEKRTTTQTNSKNPFDDILAEISLTLGNMINIDASELDEQEDFFEFGLDQITLSELANAINEKYDTNIKVDEILDHRSLEKLTKFIADHYEDKISSYYQTTPNDAENGSLSEDITLEEIAYTLQTGREMMEERLVVIVTDISDLLEKLRKFYYENEISSDMLTGNIELNAISTKFLLEVFKGADLEYLIKDLVQKNDLNKLAKLWISGVEIDWDLLYANYRPKRLSLPTYPFAKEYHWPEFLQHANEEANPTSNILHLTSVTPPTSRAVVTDIIKDDVIETVTKIWEDCLGIKKVNINDDFMEIGGNSIAASQILTQVKAIYAIDIPPSQFADVPTVAQLADLIKLELSKVNDPKESKVETKTRKQPTYAATIPMRKTKSPTTLTTDQERLWFLNQMNPNNIRHNIPALFQIRGELNAMMLNKSLEYVILDHEALRTTFGIDNGQPTQVIHDRVIMEMDFVDLLAVDEIIRIDKAKELSLKAANIPFDLENGPLIRLNLIQLDQSEYMLAIVAHHIVSDIWSLGLLIQQLFSQYDQLMKEQMIPESTRTIHMADYAQWSNDRLEVVSDKHLPYWKDKLSGIPELLDLPTDRVRPEVQSFSASQLQFVIPSYIYEKVQEQIKNTKTNLFIYMMAAFKTILKLTSNQDDILIGFPIANRGLIETTDMVGFLANTLVLRTQFFADMTFFDVVSEVKNNSYEALDHQEIPYSKVVEALQPKRGTSYNPIFQVMFNLVSMPPAYKSDNLSVEIVDQDWPTTDFDMTLRVEERSGELICFLDYSNDLFDLATIDAYAEGLVEVLKVGSTRTDVKISEITLPAALFSDKYQVGVDVSEVKHNIVIAATFTAEPLKETIEFWVKNLKLENQVIFAEYNQVHQQLLDPNQLFLKNHSGINVVMLRLEDWLRYEKSTQISEKLAVIQKNLNEFINLVKSAAVQMSMPLIVVLCPSDVRDNPGLGSFYKICADELAKELGTLERVYTIMPDEIEMIYPVADIFDTQANEVGHVPFTKEYFTALGTMIARKIRTLKHEPYKVIVLDCDNTIWKGVCGEVGTFGIEIDGPRKRFQQFMVQQYNSGILLCLSSKNNEADVIDVFNNRGDLPLRLEHFVSNRINWSPKSENIRDLAKELNLGLDSFIFIDDNPIEIEEVKANAPEVFAVQFPADDAFGISNLINHLWVLDKENISQEDRNRTEMYKKEVQRKEAQQSVSSFADFIDSLELKIAISPIADHEYNRVEQLMARTNQFNTTTQRFSAEDIRNLLATGQYHCLSVSVSDRFGDYGLVGVILYSEQENMISVDSLILSCRALGKGIEHEMLAKVGSIAMQMGVDFVSIKYIKSEKNAPVAKFLDSIQFEIVEIVEDGKLYQLSASDCKEIKFIPAGETEEETSEKKAAPATIRRGKKILERIPASYSKVEDILLAVNQEIKTTTKNQDKGKVAPKTLMEEKVALLYSEVLNLDAVGVEKNFFDLGGTSLQLVELSSKLKSISNKEVTITDLFKYPTVRLLSAFLDNNMKIKTNDKGRRRGAKQRQILMQLRGAKGITG